MSDKKCPECGGTEWEGVCCATCDYDSTDHARGDGTPGPAREAAPRDVKAALRTAELAQAFYQQWEGQQKSGTPIPSEMSYVRRLAHHVRVLASGDSGGPREAALKPACGFAGDQIRDLAEREEAALRAELGRAPNGWEPPDWVTGAFLNEMGAAYKLKCREEGREPWPAHFAMVDLIIWWWETQAKTRFKVGRAPAGGPTP